MKKTTRYDKKEKWCKGCGKYLGLVYPNRKYCDECNKKRYIEYNKKYKLRQCLICGEKTMGKYCKDCSTKSRFNVT